MNNQQLSYDSLSSWFWFFETARKYEVFFLIIQTFHNSRNMKSEIWKSFKDDLITPSSSSSPPSQMLKMFGAQSKWLNHPPAWVIIVFMFALSVSYISIILPESKLIKQYLQTDWVNTQQYPKAPWYCLEPQITNNCFIFYHLKITITYSKVWMI